MFWIQKFKNGLLIAVSILILVACTKYRPSTAGYPYRIFVVADSLLWLDLQKPISDTFEGEVLTPVSEKKFYFTWIPLRLLNEFKNRMNIFFIGVQDEQGEVNEYLRQVLPAEFQKGVAENRYFYLFQDDLFARDQIGLFMFGKDRQSFLRNFEGLKDQIYNTFEKKYYARLKESMFEKGEQVKVEEYIKNNFDFSIRVQHDYFVAIEEPQVPYLWLRRFDPDRWVSIWKIKGDSSYFNFDSIANVRDRFTKKYYQGDYIIREDSKLVTADFNGQPTAKMVGLWRNDSVLIGGPFRTYVIDYPADSSLYFIDIAVMAPGHLKKPYLDQLEVIARTFRVEKDARKER
ncbi:MAG: DUF4837 family protein [Caldisericaceae bacterium]|nr:DUF4837 family protein [Caldisericaceae bacterium]